MINILVKEYGASVNAVKRDSNEDHATPLHVAAWGGSAKNCNVLR